ncbi:helix-turn-helix domain-containing protein [Cohnella fermenti]|uniref:Helix-turn-helix transcriptional regulator n=1 Tax=Cohnella fermenti TaxID=2565925 RepID=A0A4S4BG78_9BACL|nr:helix-turn-helix domain-containing protein [Cohnella fermenti]THF73404.1 helix-turn-helix transcriptional regulator [Cohnella fermenti]
MANSRMWKLPVQTNKLYFRILSYFLLLLIPMCAVGAIVYFSNISTYRERAIEKLSSSLASSSRVIDIYLRTTEQTAMNFFINETVQQSMAPYALQGDAEREQATSIVKVISSSRNILSPYIDDLFVFADNEWIYKSEGMENFHSFFVDFNSFARYDDSFWEGLLQSDQSFQVLEPTVVTKHYTSKSGTVIPIVISEYIRGNQVVMVATISASKIVDTLVGGAIADSTSFFVMDNKDNIIVANSRLGEDRDVQSLKSAFDNGASSASIRLGGVDYVSTMTTSDFGWSYYSLTPARFYKEQATGILSVTLWSSALMLLIGIGLSFFFSTRLYNPIRNLLGAYHEREQFSSELLDHTWLHLLNGESLDKQDRFMQEIGFTGGEYQVVCIKFHFKPTFEEIQDIERVVILEKLKKIIAGVIGPQESTHILELPNQLFVAIVNLRSRDDRDALEGGLKSLLQTFQYDTRYCRLTVGVGRTYPTSGSLAKSFGEARIALAKANPKTDFQIVHSADLPVEEGFHFSFGDESKVVNGLRAGDPVLLEGIVRAIVRRNLEKDTSNTYMNLLLIELYNIGIQYAAEKGVAPARLLQEEEHLVLSGKRHYRMEIEEQLALLLRFYGGIMERTATPEDNKTGQLVSRMIAYIDDNFRSDLYLERIAEEMKMSAKYVSKAFKEITGTNLTDYIAMKRIEEAKKLLAATVWKNDEIAERVGIVSRATFFRLFKKYEGITPQEYRSMLQAGRSKNGDDN